MRTLIFDRFESERESGFTILVRDLADLLGDRQSETVDPKRTLRWLRRIVPDRTATAQGNEDEQLL